MHKILALSVLVLLVVFSPAAANEKVTLCHCPPGNPDNCKTISVGADAAAAHLSEHADDFEGSCEFQLPPPIIIDVPPEGGTGTIEGYVTVTAPEGSLDIGEQLGISITNDPETAALFNDTTPMLGIDVRLAYEIRINTGFSLPLKDLEVSFAVPDGFRSAIPAGSEIRVVGQSYWEGELEVLDVFDLFPEAFPSSDLAVTITLPPWLFTETRTPDGSFEAVLTLASTPTEYLTQEATESAAADADPVGGVAGLCKSALRLESPLVWGDITVRCTTPTCWQNEPGTVVGPYGEPRNNRAGVHKGVDVAANGHAVLAMASGVVDDVNVGGGYGHYVQIAHPNTEIPLGYTLYAHMEPQPEVPIVRKGDSVFAGEVLGYADSTGFPPGCTICGPHLHINLFDSKHSKINPYPCFTAVTPETLFLSPGVWKVDAEYDAHVNRITSHYEPQCSDRPYLTEDNDGSFSVRGTFDVGDGAHVEAVNLSTEGVETGATSWLDWGCVDCGRQTASWTVSRHASTADAACFSVPLLSLDSEQGRAQVDPAACSEMDGSGVGTFTVCDYGGNVDDFVASWGAVRSWVSFLVDYVTGTRDLSEVPPYSYCDGVATTTLKWLNGPLTMKLTHNCDETYPDEPLIQGSLRRNGYATWTKEKWRLEP